MPTYQYQCTECGEGLEAVQKFTDEALTVCPSCNGRLRKVFSAVGVVFKGSGFYRTDSRNGSSGSSTAAKSSSNGGDSGGSGSESKASGNGSSSTSTAGSGAGSSSTSGSSTASTPAA
ncbi:FmdB family transcriptional regulator [Streptomyces sp. RB6PN25]|uniref:FmdB family transcriptional regulator n=1 Tax=Streptomyces humicola TaxID=2953240 RepID=A0ABT1PVM7_9ACTN|nr:FmdB family zinc ribbon protein [Streptomyces humicola]MCQ4080585.1 FmdB family transcriptional regulator [Streptomyces humicola]